MIESNIEDLSEDFEHGNITSSDPVSLSLEVMNKVLYELIKQSDNGHM